MSATAFRFDEARHEYFIGDTRVPSITQLIEMGGLVNGAAYFTEASRLRGTAVHQLCEDFDLGALDLPKLESPFRGYVLAYVAACEALKPDWRDIEIAEAHPTLGFAGRTDRVGMVMGRKTVCEIKSAAKAKHHAVQTALQGLLAAPRLKLPAEMFQRLTIYLKPTGRYSVEIHEDRRDFDVAKDLIRRFCR